jgi:hypothetical protein
MVDADVAYLGESAVYRILSDRNLLCRVAHPQSNGLIERWHRTTRDALEDGGVPGTHPKTPKAIEAWIDHYNEQRLQAGLGSIQPAEYYQGDPAGRKTERKRRLAEARRNRRRENRAAQPTLKDHGTEQEQTERPHEVSLSENIAWSHLN